MQNLIRAASAAVGAAALTLTIPVAASAATAGPADHHPIMPRCHSGAMVVPGPMHKMSAAGYLFCRTPDRHGDHRHGDDQRGRLEVTLLRDGQPVAHARQDCRSTGPVTACRVSTQAVPNWRGHHRWCAVSKASYGRFFHETSRVCTRG